MEPPSLYGGAGGQLAAKDSEDDAGADRRSARAGSPLAVGVGVSPGPGRLVGEDDPTGDAALGDAEPCRHGLGGRARPGLLGHHRSSSDA